MAGAAGAGGAEDGRWLQWLPGTLLALATVVASAGAPVLGDAAADVRLTLAVSAATALWLWATPQPGALNWVGRTVLAFVLCWLNPLYAVFAFVGFLDAWEALGGRWAYVGLVAVSITQAGSQSGGLPPRDAVQGWVFLTLVVVNTGLAWGLTVLSVRTDRRTAELGRLNADLHAALAENQSLHAELLARARASGVQAERARIAREIHDTTAQSLAGIVAQLEASVGGERQARALDLARTALAEARRSMLDLSPGHLDGASLADALRRVTAAWSAEQGVPAEVVVAGDAVPLHPEVEATVLRIAQESLTNTAKHAAASRAGVTLTFDGDEVVLDVRDDGAGFDPTAPTADSSFGLRGMRQRAARLAGTLTVESRPRRGTAVSLRLPALAREAA